MIGGMKKLKEWRTDPNRNLSLEAAGKKVGISAVHWRRLEIDEQAPSPKLARLIESVTGIPKHELRPDLWEAA